MQKYQTDKYQGRIIPNYERLFAGMRNIRYLEVGVWRGGSLKWAKDFFPGSEIIGIDRDVSNAVDMPSDIRLIQAEQGPGLADVVMGLFDIIIDDGSHTEADTRATYAALWPKVMPGGWYVIEDWAAAYWGEQYLGMERVIAEKILNKEGISSMEIQCGLPGGGAYAAFRKAAT